MKLLIKNLTGNNCQSSLVEILSLIFVLFIKLLSLDISQNFWLRQFSLAGLVPRKVLQYCNQLGLHSRCYHLLPISEIRVSHWYKPISVSLPLQKGISFRFIPTLSRRYFVDATKPMYISDLYCLSRRYKPHTEPTIFFLMKKQV